MNFNASNFLLSLSDLFVIIIPGFLMLAFVLLIFWRKKEWFEATNKSLGVGTWIVVLVFSFLAGHFVSQLGSLAEDAYWETRPGDIANEHPKMRDKVVKLASAILSPDVDVTPINARRWAAVLLR